MDPERLLKMLQEALDRGFQAQEERLGQRFQRIDERFQAQEERLGHLQVLLEGVQGDVKALAEGLDGYRRKMENGLSEPGREREVLDRRVMTLEAKTGELDRRVGLLEN